LLALDVPLNQSIFNVIELRYESGTIVDSVAPAPIGAAHMDAASAIAAAAVQCTQMAIYASPAVAGMRYDTAPPVVAYGSHRWSYSKGKTNERIVYTFMPGTFTGSPAGSNRDGLDFSRSLIPGVMAIEYSDVEILETAYPVLFSERRIRTDAHGYGKFRSGAACQETFTPHGVDEIAGNLTGTCGSFPQQGSAGGMPGSLARVAVTRKEGARDTLSNRAAGVSLVPGDQFEMRSASAGGFGDPLDRDPFAILVDVKEERLSTSTAELVYGVVFAGDDLDVLATLERREFIRQRRLAAAMPAIKPLECVGVPSPSDKDLPIYPGVVQRGRFAVAVESGAPLAVAPDSWLNGCPVLEEPLDGAGAGVVRRGYLDPFTGRFLHLDVALPGGSPTIEILPDRWVRVPNEEHSSLPADS